MRKASQQVMMTGTVAACGLIFGASQAVAQSAEGTTSADTEIVVTAQRREEKAKDVPITLTTITADSLGNGDVQQLSDIAKLTPGLRFDNFGGFAQPTIRGVGTAVAASGAGSNVGIYVDGFYAPNPLSNDFQLLNVSSVTVLKGPQGTLFGRNSTGGAIQVTTTDPSAQTRGLAEVSYGRYNSQRYQAYVTTGTDRIAFDLAGLYRKGDGFVRNIVTGSKKDAAYDAWSIRAGVKLKVSETASLLFRYTHADTDDPTYTAYNSLVVNGVVQSAGAALSPLIPGGVVAASERGEVSATSGAEFNSKVDTFQLTGELDLGFGTLRSYSQYRDESSLSFLDLDGSSLPIFDVEFLITDKIFTQELILTSQGSGPLQWTVGGFYFSDKNRFRYLDGFVAGGPRTLVSRSQTDTTSVAAFADVTYNFGEKFFLTGGLRYSNDKTKNGGFFLGPLAGGGGFVPIPEISNDQVTPRVVLRYKPSEASSVYASFTRGHKAAILNAGGFSTVPIAPEKISAFEVGYKYAARGLSFDLSGYYYDYKNLQVASYNGTQSLITNAANSRVYGVEGQLAYQVTDHFQFNLAAAYTDAKYNRFLTSPRFDQCLVPACGAGFGLFVNSTVDASGFRMARAPEFTGNVGARYETDLAGGKFALSGNLAYTSKIFFDTAQQFSTDGYELLSMRAEWTDRSDRYTLAVYGDNITDSKYYNQILPGQFAVQTVWGQPVTWGVSARAKF
ncbi:TonB-dependent receptor [Novosphingobium sp.]|uniref:TonB-dependent receptor n=1 Tax=Novosphingobium sp. TaxID=1874826 RepID=UPI002638F36B|nr:TonB-dependent receptor [Novosphingobium sp.]